MKFPIRPIHALVAVALVAACGGTSYAAATIGSAQIVDNSIRSVDLKDGNVRTADLQNGGVTLGKLSPATRSALGNQWRIEGTAKEVAAGGLVDATVMCDFAHGEYAAGGGGYSYYPGKGYLTGTAPVYGQGEYQGTPVGWTVSMQNVSNATNYVIIRAECVRG